ncbi:uncharacterized protein SAMN04487936_103182 [Halobacillus dabanensis]|uniref:DUF418 domain-containing protein n=1 Tax=Halobacillus dabanensis TaxID=240302 RepID=A0A1I3T5C8_HALDA|nr:DUF418 domain-containing protein [Halobacillus dabanensis]SFJ64727.1 uncharacterized protein SAMN04487936_103182 [Halobacillus dabanensis]
MKMTASPLRESERLDWIDAARGFAILGIFMVNVPAFNAPYFLYGGAAEYWSTPLSHTVQAIIDIFFQASFYTLFSFMFGFGIQMMKDRLDEKGIPARSIIFRRLVVLTGFGMIHAFLIWHGDILLSYGVLGFVLLAFFHVSSKNLLWWAYSLLAFGVLPLTLAMFLVRDQIQGIVNRPAIEAARTNYGNGSLMDIWSQNLDDWIYANQWMNLPFLALSLLPMFLFGMYFCRKRLLHYPEKYQMALKKIWILTGLLFLLFKAGPHLFGSPEWFQLAQDSIGGSASAIFYVLSITLLFRTKIGARIIHPLTWVGRMSLSNYILQSIISFWLFYSVGLGLYGEVPPIGSVFLVIIFYTLQIVISKAWLKKYRFGPLEWLWRTLTYGKRQPLKRKNKAVS